MPVAYSEDLRWRAIWLHLYGGLSVTETARVLYVSDRTIYRYVERFMLIRDIRKFSKKNGPPRILSEHEEMYVVDLVLSSPGIYLREVQQQLFAYTGSWVHESTICRTLRRNGLTRQKIQQIALQRSEILRAEFMAEVMMVYKSSLCLWIDETGCDRRNSLRQYGYGIRGQTPQNHSLKLRGKRYSALSILSREGIEDTYIVEGNVNGDIFMDFLQKQLLPILLPFDGDSPRSVVIMDNASIHHVDAIVAAILSTGALLKFLPPYSPDLNPIEFVFGEMKQYLQSNNILFQTSLSSEAILYMAFNSVNKENCNQYINHTGYT